MPEKVHKQLVREALAKGPDFARKENRKVILTDRGRAYVYGTLNKIEKGGK